MQKYEVTYLKGQGENFTELAKEYARENIGAASDNFVKTEIDKKQDQLTKGPNIDIYTKDKKTYISATIPSEYATKEWVESQGYAKDTKTWEELEKKLDLSAFSEVSGYYNKPYEDQTFAVGNGTEDERSNAMRLDKYGNMIIKGDLTINGDTSLNTLLVNPKFALTPYSYEIRDIFTAPYTHTMSLTPEKRIKAFDNLDIFVMPSGTYKYDFDCDIHVIAERYTGMEDWELRLAKNILEVSGTVELSEVPAQITRGAKTDTSTEIKFADRYGKTIGAIVVPCPNVSVNNYNIGEFVINDLDHELKYEIKFNDDAFGTVYINNYEMYDNIIDSIEMIDDGYKIFRLKLEGFTVSDKHFELVPEIYRNYSSAYNKTDINQITVNVHDYYIEKLK